MKRQVLAALGALFVAGCATWSYPLEDTGDGVYYAESPPDYVYAGYGLGYASLHPWMGPPYLYPGTFYSPYHTLGSRWYHPPFGTFDYWAMDPYSWERQLLLSPHAAGRYASGYNPKMRMKTRGGVQPAPDYGASRGSSARFRVAKPSPRSSAPPRSRPPRGMRSAPAPRPSRAVSRKLD